MDLTDFQGVVAAVPDHGAGLCALVAGFGRLSRSKLPAPAVRLARDGFIVSPSQTRIGELIKPIITDTLGIARVVSLNGRLIKAGDRLRTAILQTVGNIVDFSLSASTVVNRPWTHFEGQPVERKGGFNLAAADGLEQIGFQVNRWRQRSMFDGGVHTAGVENGYSGGSGDPRRGGAVGILPRTVPRGSQ